MAYKIKYDEEADVLTIILKGKLSHAEEVGDTISTLRQKRKTTFHGNTQSQQDNPTHG
jgi:hypothetical protein